jgi:glycosyltransferase involved in cell wall biosynthesis
MLMLFIREVYMEPIKTTCQEQKQKNVKLFKKELIIIDDASKDNSIKIIKKYEEKNLCRAIYNKKSKGLIKSSNIGIKASKGRFIMRLDADDYLDPNSLSVLLNAIMKDSNIALVYSDYYLVDEKRNILSLEKQTIRNKEGLLDHKPVLAACCLIRRSSIFSVNLYDERFTRQDGYDLWYKLLKNFKFEHVPLPLFFYRKHGKNLTKNQNKLYKTRTKILRKFSEKKNKIKDLNINCVIPVRGPNVDKFCNSLELLNKNDQTNLIIKKALHFGYIIVFSESSKKYFLFFRDPNFVNTYTYILRFKNDVDRESNNYPSINISYIVIKYFNYTRQTGEYIFNKIVNRQPYILKCVNCLEYPNDYVIKYSHDMRLPERIQRNPNFNEISVGRTSYYNFIIDKDGIIIGEVIDSLENGVVHHLLVDKPEDEVYIAGEIKISDNKGYNTNSPKYIGRLNIL